jgi:hypothetical protein
MPTNLIYATCEKVLVDESQTASLISIFDKLTVNAPENAEIPRNGIAVKEWAVYASWIPEADDVGKTYKVATQVFYPDETPFADVVRFDLAMKAGKRAQGIARFNGFPIGQVGAFTVSTWLEYEGKRIGTDRELTIDVEISRQPANAKPA